MMMMMCKRLAQVPMPCVPIYNMKLAMMQTNSHFYYFFSTYEDGRRQTRAKRGVCPKYYNIIMYVDLFFFTYIDDSIIEIFQNVSVITNQNNTLFRTPRSCIKAAKRFSKHQKRHRQTNKYGRTNGMPPMISHYIPL